MKVILVDDDYEKACRISNALGAHGVAGSDVTHETTADAARRRMRERKFDLAIIDLHLPESLGGTASSSGGLELYKLLCLDKLVNLPADIFFVTAKEDVAESMAGDIRATGATLCQYRADCESWKIQIAGRVKYIQERNRREDLVAQKVDVAIITALRSPELEAVLRLPYSWKKCLAQDDATTYYFGTIDNGERKISVVAASAERKGMPSSAALAAKLTLRFSPTYLAMLGICAGVKGRVNLGSVVVADPSWDWGSGKNSEDAEGASLFLAAPYQVPLDADLRRLANDMAADPDVAGKIRGGWSQSLPAGEFKVVVAPMASGGSVIADASTTLVIGKQHREVTAIEMEAYAVMAAAEYAIGPVRPKAIVIKSVCDYADSLKNDDWQEYASYTSAAFADLLFRNPHLRIG